MTCLSLSHSLSAFRDGSSNFEIFRRVVFKKLQGLHVYPSSLLSAYPPSFNLSRLLFFRRSSPSVRGDTSGESQMSGRIKKGAGLNQFRETANFQVCSVSIRLSANVFGVKAIVKFVPSVFPS